MFDKADKGPSQDMDYTNSVAIRGEKGIAAVIVDTVTDSFLSVPQFKEKSIEFYHKCR